ncbi:CBS domain-containing protein [Halomicrococcus gelatinilyticus]|uniref:CBS domain-containing protein n=1 Tax=Halomicrococcus gelatinilyticus TaxID=1702103 RepID=UPI002E1142CB
MNISNLVSTEFETVDVDAPVSKLEGKFADPELQAVVVTDDDEYSGLVTRRQLNTAHRHPDEKARNLVWHVSKVAPDENVRTVARLLIGSRSRVLPAFDDGDLHGVVTADAVLDAVRSYLGVLSVSDVYSHDLVTVAPTTTMGEALHLFRERDVTHLPVVERPDARADEAASGDVVGVVSIFDSLDFSAREMGKEQGGSPDRFDRTGGRSHGGFGERAGELERMLDLPVRNVMSEPARTTAPDRPLDEAVGTMLDEGISSLVVTSGDGPAGIVTKTDALEALTWTEERHLTLQIDGIDLLDDVSREELRGMIERTADKYARMTVYDAHVYLHEHKESFRGTPLVLARIRLFTDKGQFVGTGEGYGAGHALRLARNRLERQILEGKEYARSKKHPSLEEQEKLLGWWLAG